MKADRSFLRSKVGRRVFSLFILCALLPIGLLSLIAYVHVSAQLEEQSHQRLRQESKTIGMAVYERLLFLEANLNLIASKLAAGGGKASENLFADLGEELGGRFKGLVLMSEGGDYSPLVGRIQMPPDQTIEQQGHISSSKTLVSVEHGPGVPSRVFMSRLLDTRRSESGVVLGEIDSSYLWGLGRHGALPTGTELCVLEASGTVLICSFQGVASFSKDVAFSMANSASSSIEWEREGEPYLAGFWSIPLKFRFSAPAWTVVLSEAKADVLAPMANFEYTLSLVLMMSLCVVALLSVGQIRRSLIPLEKLREGTRRIANRDFASRVTISSGDEFEELAASFNTMAGRLGRQFDTLATISEIDRAVLSTLEINTIAGTVVGRVGDVFGCDLVALALVDREVSDAIWLYLREPGEGGTVLVEGAELTSDDVQRFREQSEHLMVEHDGMLKSLEPLGRRGMKAFLVMPLFRGQEFSGFIAMSYRRTPDLSHDDIVQARQLANQVAAALAKAHDVAERRRAEGLLQESNRQLQDALGELQTAQKQMVQQERLRALGQMASGIAHDFNNTLSPIVGFSELLLLNPKSLADSNKVRDHLRIINTAAHDATKVVSRLRDFYRPRVQEDFSRSVNLNQLIDQTVTLTQPKWKDQALANGVTIQMQTELQEIPPIAGNESEFREVLTNLIFNAVDAMLESGTIGLRTRAEEGNVVLEVADTGMGMSEEVRQRCLEPFFSTKGDRGTGLGLSMVYGIVCRHQGTIDIRSHRGEGTTFVFRFPVQREKSTANPVPQQKEVAPKLHVLVADDDALVRRVTTEYLRSVGYTVETASDGGEALEKFREGKFDLVITDQGMPGISGDQLALGIKQIRLDIPVIMLTGVGRMAEGPEESTQAVDFLVHKPLTMAALQDVLSRVTAMARSGKPKPTEEAKDS